MATESDGRRDSRHTVLDLMEKVDVRISTLSKWTTAML